MFAALLALKTHYESKEQQASFLFIVCVATTRAAFPKVCTALQNKAFLFFTRAGVFKTVCTLGVQGIETGS
jgi:hypothetical protein